jgi:4-hydroxy-tetrahydrodipicolinate reductase
MKIALFGYGKMGHMIEEAAARHQLEVVCIIDPIAGNRGELSSADVCIDFTQPDAVIDNVRRCASAKKPVVIGTTGWYTKLDEVRAIVETSDIGLIYGSNFSIGVNLMFKLVERAGELFKSFEMYDPFLEEAHLKFKMDAPSGTAFSLKKIVEGELGRTVPTASTRAGYIPGTHTLGFDSEVDTLTITHTARSRAGFAEGAIVAAKWIVERKGFYEFPQIF